MQVAKTQTYPVMYRFPLFVALCDHNPPTLQTGVSSLHKRDIACLAKMNLNVTINASNCFNAGVAEEDGDRCTQQSTDVATGSSDGGGVADVKMIKQLDIDAAAALLADNVTESDVAEAAGLMQMLAEKREPPAGLEHSASHSQGASPAYNVIGPIPWGHSGPVCHALSLSSLSWTSMRRRRATVPLATSGE